ncbi:imidazoleglycerol-phosphate dehydratase HisB [Chloroflexota bacterium]
MKTRKAAITRKTAETDILLEFGLDGSGKWQIETGIAHFDHLLSGFTRHGVFDLNLKATGDDPHHLIEDIAICLGKALLETVGDGRGITRTADAMVPMDEALATVVVDIGGRGYCVQELDFEENDMPGFTTDLIRHFLESFAQEARLNLHAHIPYGTNDHHKAEALFKALGRALDKATTLDARLAGKIPSTKNRLER